MLPAFCTIITHGRNGVGQAEEDNFPRVNLLQYFPAPQGAISPFTVREENCRCCPLIHQPVKHCPIKSQHTARSRTLHKHGLCFLKRGLQKGEPALPLIWYEERLILRNGTPRGTVPSWLCSSSNLLTLSDLDSPLSEENSIKRVPASHNYIKNSWAT